MKFKLRSLPITLLSASLSCAAALAQTQPSSNGPVCCRLGFPISKMKTQSIGPANPPAETPSSPSYTYTLLSFPGNLYTYASGINPGASSSKTQIVGGLGSNSAEGGFLLGVSGTKTVIETYHTVNYPHDAPQQAADAINEPCEIVGVYYDTSGVSHGWERGGGK